MKKLIIVSTIILMSFALSACDTNTEDLDYEDLQNRVSSLEDQQDRITSLESDVEALENEIDDLEELNETLLQDNNNLEAEIINIKNDATILSNTVILLEDLVESLDMETFAEQVDELRSLLGVSDELDIINASLDALSTSIASINEYDLDMILELNDTVQDLTDSISVVNTTLQSILSSNQELSDYADELQSLFIEIDTKLNSLRSFDINNYPLTDDKVHELIFSLDGLYSTNMPNDNYLPSTSSDNSDCLALTYETCQTSSGAPYLYTSNFNFIAEEIEGAQELYKYIESFSRFMSNLQSEIIPVFINETDYNDLGEITYTYRSETMAVYELIYNDTIDSNDYRIDAKLTIIMGDFYVVKLTMDIKEETLGISTTVKTLDYEFYTDTVNPIVVAVHETNYPNNKSYLMKSTGDISSFYVHDYEEMEMRKQGYIAYNSDYSQLHYVQSSYNPENISYAVDELYTSQGLFYYETSQNSSVDFIPLRWYDNWDKIYYREDGELTKIKISKIILDDNTELIVSDETISDSYTKIYRDDFIFYNSSGNVVSLDGYLVVGRRTQSVIEQNMPYVIDYTTTMSEISSINLHDYFVDLSDEIVLNHDVSPYTYMEEIVVTKTREEVYQDALDFLDLAQQICPGDSYCYYDNDIDSMLVGGFDELYYDENSYVYYPDNYQRVYLYAINPGDFEFYGKDPTVYTDDDVTINP